MKDREIIQENIKESKEQIRKAILKDNLIMFFTRIIEDIKLKKPDFYGRIVELFPLIHPYDDFPEKENLLKKLIPVKSNGIELTQEEKDFIEFLLTNLNPDFTLKQNIYPKLNGMFNHLVKKYLPNTSETLEPYLIGKLISSVGGIETLYKMPSSTIQLIGAEKALFRHISRKALSPKYGLIYQSKNIQTSDNKGKAARQLANKISLNIRVDYFKNFAR